MITFAGATTLIVIIFYLLGFMKSGTVNKAGGCIMILIILAFLIGAGILTLLMAISWM